MMSEGKHVFQLSRTSRYLLILAGVSSIVFGVSGSVPFYFQQHYSFAILSSLLIIFGLVLLAIAFGEEDEY